VLDFGISKMTDPSGSGPGSMTRTTALMGSPLYMSPEQMRSSKDVDARTDIWALGVILFELMTGRPAFIADSVTELAIKVATDAGARDSELSSRRTDRARSGRLQVPGEGPAPAIPQRGGACAGALALRSEAGQGLGRADLGDRRPRRRTAGTQVSAGTHAPGSDGRP
jgi:serine/threonine protein kinase